MLLEWLWLGARGGGGCWFLGGFGVFLNSTNCILSRRLKTKWGEKKQLRKVLSQTTLVGKSPVYHDAIQRICQMNCSLPFSVVFAYELAKNNGSFIWNPHVFQVCSLFLAYGLCEGARYPENKVCFSSSNLFCCSCWYEN